MAEIDENNILDDETKDIKDKNFKTPEFRDLEPTGYIDVEPTDVREYSIEDESNTGEIEKYTGNAKKDVYDILELFDDDPVLKANMKKIVDIMEKKPSKEELSQIAAAKGAEFISDKLLSLSQGNGSEKSTKRSNKSRRAKRVEQESIAKREEYLKNDFRPLVEKMLREFLRK